MRRDQLLDLVMLGDIVCRACMSGEGQPTGRPKADEIDTHRFGPCRHGRPPADDDKQDRKARRCRAIPAHAAFLSRRPLHRPSPDPLYDRRCAMCQAVDSRRRVQLRRPGTCDRRRRDRNSGNFNRPKRLYPLVRKTPVTIRLRSREEFELDIAAVGQHLHAKSAALLLTLETRLDRILQSWLLSPDWHPLPELRLRRCRMVPRAFCRS